MSQKKPHSTIQCLTAVAQHHGLQIDQDQMQKDYADVIKEPSVSTLLNISTDLGLKAKAKKLSWKKLLVQTGKFPMIARLADGNALIIVSAQVDEDEQSEEHKSLVFEATSARIGQDSPEETPKPTKTERKIAVIDPTIDKNAVIKLEKEEFCQRWKGEVVIITRKFSITDPNQPFSLKWFIPEILRQKVAFKDIALAVFVIHVLALASPIFFQLVLDKVLAHKSASTLQVLAIGIVIAMVYETIFSYIRELLTVAATNKIDMRVTRKTFKKLLSLPIDYFETSTAGGITRHMQQLSAIRNFLTGSLFFTFLELTAVIIFIPILFTYSVKLAYIVLGFTLVIATILISLLPATKRRLEKLFAAEGKRQAMLVETIRGMRTIKALAIEPTHRRNWDEISSESINRSFQVRTFMLIGSSITGFMGKILPITIIVVGAFDVFDQTMTIGALIAFQMISARVSGPLIATVGLINEYQQIAIATKMLGDIMNRTPEQTDTGSLRPKLAGAISLDNVTFSYPKAKTVALDQTSFDIPAGAVVGLVGRSGSGKTTLTKIIQGLYKVNGGRVLFDGIDAREINLTHLRQQIGIVLQENFLFRGTVRENIAMTKPDASFEEIVEVAQTAGADEFIERLPMGYDTFLEENAANLSGGQKQRLSIARALLPKPNILILDEAASALDPQSEAIFIKNLSRIAVGRTVLMVSHRLSTLVKADAILVMDQGSLMDSGRHEELLTRCLTYQQLWNQQTSHL